MPRGSDDPIQIKSIQLGDIKIHIISLLSAYAEQKNFDASLNIHIAGAGGGGGYTQGSERIYSYYLFVESGGKTYPFDIWAESLRQRLSTITGVPTEKIEIIPREEKEKG